MSGAYCIEGHPRFVPGCSMCEWRKTTEPEPVPGTIDAAWAEVEAALPKRWLFGISPYYPKGYEAAAWHADVVPGAGSGKRRTPACYGLTATAALLALAERLRERVA